MWRIRQFLRSETKAGLEEFLCSVHFLARCPRIEESPHLGDLDLSGAHIENNTREELEGIVGYKFNKRWKRIALTEDQVDKKNLRHLEIQKLDNRFNPPRRFPAIETETLSQTVIVDIVRTALSGRIPTALQTVLDRAERQREWIAQKLEESEEEFEEEFGEEPKQ